MFSATEQTLKGNLCEKLSSFVSEETLYPGRIMEATVWSSLSAETHSSRTQMVNDSVTTADEKETL